MIRLTCRVLYVYLNFGRGVRMLAKVLVSDNSQSVVNRDRQMFLMNRPSENQVRKPSVFDEKTVSLAGSLEMSTFYQRYEHLQWCGNDR